MDLALGQIESLSNLRASGKEALGAGPDGVLRSIGGGHDRNRLRLQVGLMHHAGPIAPLNYYLSLTPAGLDITLPQVAPVTDVLRKRPALLPVFLFSSGHSSMGLSATDLSSLLLL